MNIINSFISLFFPNICLVCRKKLTKNDIICKKCINDFARLETNKCLLCRENPAENGICQSCRTEFQFDGVVSVFKFNEVIQSLIHNLKYNEFKKIGIFLGEFLADKLSNYDFISKIDYIIPVPLHKVKKRERGFNQSDIIAKALSDKLNIKLGNHIVKRAKYTKTQTRLTKKEREINVRNAFKIKSHKDVKNKNFLIVDDVITTGSTMKSIALLLKEYYANQVYVASIARA